MPESRAMDAKPKYWLSVCHPGTGSRHPAGTTTERDHDHGLKSTIRLSASCFMPGCSLGRCAGRGRHPYTLAAGRSGRWRCA